MLRPRLYKLSCLNSALFLEHTRTHARACVYLLLTRKKKPVKAYVSNAYKDIAPDKALSTDLALSALACWMVLPKFYIYKTYIYVTRWTYEFLQR